MRITREREGKYTIRLMLMLAVLFDEPRSATNSSLVATFELSFSEMKKKNSP